MWQCWRGGDGGGRRKNKNFEQERKKLIVEERENFVQCQKGLQETEVAKLCYGRVILPLIPRKHESSADGLVFSQPINKRDIHRSKSCQTG